MSRTDKPMHGDIQVNEIIIGQDPLSITKGGRDMMLSYLAKRKGPGGCQN